MIADAAVSVRVPPTRETLRGWVGGLRQRRGLCSGAALCATDLPIPLFPGVAKDTPRFVQFQQKVVNASDGQHSPSDIRSATVENPRADST
jgi:hypothetical protein